MTADTATALSGVLFIHSEMGSEGGYWAFQDNAFIGKNNTLYTCTHCGLSFDESEESESRARARGATDPGDNVRLCEHAFTLTPAECWSFDGYHTLETGDLLRVFNKEDPSQLLWEGPIVLESQNSLVRDEEGKPLGWGMHYKPTNVDEAIWTIWFQNLYPAELRQR